ncbi:MAG: Holliday junction branch migration DNA helicase RuvB [Candidatus Izemoplasmatales bacterium]|jgi:Holliday junction DNA helicase RuvB|nr:Holliday junction branch migration DNA helicase RuvB [Candidatus Izemoplasmatales bacterium]MDD4987316.1 Holliday junction branch migration DNA helicase RuvB [Candidatus Izemoplasmatales bacterium]MDD5601822.1 Holliday junction branch migration DNA helicase RuvB [Candidatus Izemoplasmatales bacterium]MDY0373855.1 Holliday junction branch migration DNA helicase RuvB [Candidatus Izemoplasmatales bacterium]NLF48340.1 Holliday junction branch migration DNA helicase RuvB [Acholeplasmataceae bacte
MDKRIISSNLMVDDEIEVTLRPRTFLEYIGQHSVKDMMSIAVQAAKKREESLDHVLLYGPPGLGKTTLAAVIANELQVSMKTCSGPTIERTGDLAAILTSLEPGDVLFIDEIHRLPKIVEEILYSSMEDFVIDIVVGKDAGAKSIRVDLPPFTLIGATTRFGDLSGPLRERFGIVHRLDFYSDSDLETIGRRTAKIYDCPFEETAIIELAKRSRGTPRIVNRLFRRVRDYADILGDGTITYQITCQALEKLKIDESGLDRKDREYLGAIIDKYKGGPVGLETLATSISEDPLTLEDVYEPFLIQKGFLSRTPRGRVATEKAYRHLKKTYQDRLF